MPSKSKQQQKFFGLVLAYKKGDVSREEVSKKVADAADSMTLKQIEDFAATEHKGLPKKVKKKKSVKESRFLMNFDEFKKV